FWTFFHKGERKNKSHFHSYCKACVQHHLNTIGATANDITQGAAVFEAGTRSVPDIKSVGATRGEKSAWTAHLIGGQVACSHASDAAKAYATAQRKMTQEKEKGNKRSRSDSTPVPSGTEPPPKRQQLPSGQTTLTTFRRNDMPFSRAEAKALQAQALRAVVSSGSPLRVFEDPEMKILFGMLRSTAPGVMPTGKVVGGRLLDEAAADVEVKIERVMKNKKLGLSYVDHSFFRSSFCRLLTLELSYLLELIDATALGKDGPSLCEQFGLIIDRVEEKHNCIVIYFTTDADGGSKKGRILLGKKRPWLILPSCWAHQFQLILGDYFKTYDFGALIAEDATALISWINNHSKVRKIFDDSQATISQDRNGGRIIILAYLVANLTRWTTHFVAFLRLFTLRSALQLAVLQKRSAIIAAEVGAATSTEAQRLTDDATKFCALIEDASFWSGLETVLGDIEPICLGTNINQKDSTRLDQVLLTITGIYLRFADHPEPEVREKMLARLERRWKDCDQPAFLVALILNHFEKLSCFGPNANMNRIKCSNLVLQVYHRINSRPDNEDTPAEKAVKEKQVSKSVMQYLAGTGDFADFDPVEWKQTHSEDPIDVWAAFADSSHLTELCEFAITILHIVANQAGCEHTFSRTKIEQSDRRSRLGLEKTDKRTKHQRQGLYKSRKGRKNHKSIDHLLSVPRYRDLLEDQNDEDPSERGHALVSSTVTWRNELARWIA
ncbi:ribonuclease H-like domain-containing protein, partial [Mycena galopus ATCC 62051]